ncbi:MAG TPA: DegV family protein [Anaerolineales bacterium]|nr:DegV family protein [Anaerolineales bacterium]HNE03060.1 DegV family protein [Anaerolineales bacterium]HNF93887.1 DegV family protein [Anaerolineales bacterium]HNH25846.1 DegV family protein [Anaerolineales bacterium]HNM36550.1 DegV family protein [Anaerolineales bacterium]
MKIVTDCAADMSNEELKQLGIVQAPLFIQFPEGEVNSADISADEFYNRLEAMRPQIPTTAQPSSGIFAELYRKLAQIDKNILSVHISSGLSGTINSARDGGEQVKGEANVNFWDTLTLSGGERFQVMAAALADKAGWAMDKVQERLTKIREKTEVIYTLDTLEYLARGGRIGRVQAMAGALLNLKPVIRVDTDGKYSTVAKGRSIGKSMSIIADHLVEKYGNAPVWVTVLHGRFAEKADQLAEEFKQKLNVAKMEVQRISPVLGVHTGPGIVGAAVVPMELMGDLV